jgi:hypothetical protein
MLYALLIRPRIRLYPHEPLENRMELEDVWLESKMAWMNSLRFDIHMSQQKKMTSSLQS